MKTLQLLFIFQILTFQFGYAQGNNVPKNINQALEFLRIDCTDSLKTLIQETSDDKLIDISYPWRGEYKTIFNWFNGKNEGVRISKYLRNRGISYNPHQEEIILKAFKLQLKGKPVNEKQILKPYLIIESKWNEEDKVRSITDSLRGIYIPKDLNDCLSQIDKFWNDSTKTVVKSWKEDVFAGRAHLGFGMWMRNNWQLWGGSRLSNYFNKMGITNPEDMSGIILISYHRYLLGQNVKLQEQIKYYQNCWSKAKTDDSLREVKDFKEYHIGDTVTYNYKLDFVSKEQEEKSDQDICHAKGLVIEKDENKLLLKVRIIETCDKKGIIIYDNDGTLEYDKTLKRFIAPKKRVIRKGYLNDEFWFTYGAWEPKDN
jgi:hypothetical protein